MEALWETVDRYLDALLITADPILEEALKNSEAAGLPAHQVAPNQAKLLWLLAKILGAKNILEIGTLGGYSTIWMARALPAGGRLITLEAEPAHAAVARKNLASAGFADLAEVRVGRAMDLLPKIAEEGSGPFDLVFIDADKQNNPGYFTWALKLTHPGSLIIVDNIVRGGAVADPASTDTSVLGTRRFFEMVAAESRVDATAFQTVGVKGYDGLAIALVTGDA